MTAPSQGWRYTVRGFGSHVEMRTVDFGECLENSHFCFLCGEVSSRVLRLACRHVMCDICACTHATHLGGDITYSVDCCGYSSTYCDSYLYENVVDREVRCFNSGCDFVGRLKDLNEHLRHSCDRYLMACSKCESTYPFMDMRKHYTACRDKTGVFIREADARSLLDNLDAAFKKLQQALASARPKDRDALRNTVCLVSEQIARIRGQLDTGFASYKTASELLRLDK
ncbi:hypothetical protein HPB50_007296 [Hyalomma asiaticum]|uniref:Uncharacterized protein n=1 Tax=Hyalomma asiaticum TaxID=266040 RepID=A0ACB7RI63_HYAAI|nr:hypothetical protein HPB50_007296 [Hyalomma asiaticum]